MTKEARAAGAAWPSQPAYRLALALLCPLAALALQWLFWDHLKPYAWVLLYPAVFFSSWIGGRRAGMAATLLSALIASWYFIPPPYSFSFATCCSLAAVLIFTAMGFLFSIFHDRLRQALMDLQEAKNELELRVQQRTAELSRLVEESHAKDAALRESEERLRLFIDYAPAALAMFDREMRYLYASQRWRADYGLGDRPLAGVLHYQVFPEIMPEWMELHRRGLAGETLKADADPFRRADGRIQWIRWEIRPWHHYGGDIGGIVIFTEDVTELKRSEERLAQLNAELEERVAQRTDALDRSHASLEVQNVELQRAYAELEAESIERIHAVEELRQREQLLIHQSRLAAMGEMLGYIAHQWRQPLNVLGLNLQMLGLSYQHGSFNGELLQESVGKAMEVIRHLSRTIDDFRDFLVLNKEKTLFAVNEVIAKTVGLIREQLKKEGIEVSVESDTELQVNGFANEYSHVILNLLSNARDAFQEQGPVEGRRICIRSWSEKEKSVVTVTDNAGGIKPGVIDKIFDAYFTTKGVGKGSGVGLFMSKMIIEKNMGGRLLARNVEGGAEFRIEV